MPKSLRDPKTREHRLAAIEDPHVAQLTEFVHALRAEMGPEYGVPYFDPADGGTSAEPGTVDRDSRGCNVSLFQGLVLVAEDPDVCANPPRFGVAPVGDMQRRHSIRHEAVRRADFAQCGVVTDNM